uniref:Uncharacterized protein n=1 Tax=Rhizophora mucronata TaxID=61149 RepID=A0A2P2LPZ3_RHIMU
MQWHRTSCFKHLTDITSTNLFQTTTEIKIISDKATKVELFGINFCGK